MYLLLLAILGAGASLLLALQVLPGSADDAASQAPAQVLQYQAFVYTSLAFFAKTPAPPVTTAYGWSAMKAAAAPSMVQAGMPPHWKAVRRPDGYWVTCTELSEAALAKLPALFPTPSQPPASGTARLLAFTIPAGSISVVVGNGGGSEAAIPSYVVLGQQGGEAAGAANLCGGT